jgi:hypothetical protein
MTVLSSASFSRSAPGTVKPHENVASICQVLSASSGRTYTPSVTLEY